MKSDGLRKAIGGIDDDLVESTEKYVSKRQVIKKRTRRIFAAAAAAAVIVIVLTAALLPALLKKTGPGFIQIDPSVKESMRNQSALSAPIYFGNLNSTGVSGGAPAEVDTRGLSVTAKLIDALPDTYTFFDDWRQTEFGVLKMSTVELLNGAEMTAEFYYLIPVGFMTDYSVFDRFVILDMAQFGYDYSVMYNKTQQKAEQFDLVLFGYRNIGYETMGENLMVFDGDGNFDTRLWNSNDLWRDMTKDAQPPENISEAEELAKQSSRENDLYVHLLKDITGDAANVLSEIESFENGVFVPRFSTVILNLGPEVQFHAVRYINGFATNEKVSVWDKEWDGGENDTYAKTKAHFSDDDLRDLPDLAPAIVTVAKAFDNGEIAPPHISNAGKLKLTAHGIFGWYAKTGNGVIGIVRVTWRYQSGELDDAYFYIEIGSDKIVSVSRDELLRKIGDYEKTYIFEGSYNENGKSRPFY